MAAGVAIISLGSHEGASADSFFMFSFVYGFSMGAYSYALKLYVYEKVRARNFSRAWSFVQFAQGLPLMIGIPLSGFLNEYCSPLSGFYVSGSAVCIGSMCMFFIDVRKYLIRKKNKKIHRHKHHHIKGSESTHSRLKFAGTDSETQTGGEEGFEDGRCTPSCKESIRRDSFADEDDLMAPLAIINQTSLAALGGQFGDPLVPELTCISEEGIADMDIPEHLFDEFDFEMNIDPDDEISSCDKVENCLVLSEYENNLKKHKETAQITNEKRGRRWSIFKLGQKTDHRLYRHSSVRNGSLKMTHPYNQRREIDVIEEASI
ncbi:uncharacterized protein LOC136043799 [Artemia franciscana]|uniref:uncharacterized protein LOC136043799 n=1 Tax=Artemia franciscana TaxID=6661 RepID=UPI0032DB9AEA